MLTRIRSSLSTRLLLLFLCAGLVLLFAVGSITGKGMARHFRHNIRPFVVHYVELLEQELGIPPSLERARQITREIPLDIHVFGPDQRWSTSGTLIDREAVDEEFRDQHRHGRPFSPRRRLRLERIDHELVFRSRSGPYAVYYQIHDSPPLRSIGPYGFILIGTVLGVLVLIYIVTRWLFRPIDEIQRGVKAIGEGDLDHRIERHRNDELGELTDNVNAMADQISDMLEAKRQLLLAISHELRSPLTRSRVNLALLDKSRAQQEIERDIAAMEQLITELLESERLNTRHASLQLESCRLDQQVNDTLARDFPHERFVVELQPVTLSVDVVRIRLLLRNLLGNALTHSRSGDPCPEVLLCKENGQVVLEVRDHGAGIAAEHLPYLTEPFYRADPSRQRKTGGYGIGLYLCRMIAEAHGGQLEISSQPGVGTRVRCLLPMVSGMRS